MGFIITPDSDRPNLYSLEDLKPWAADNGCFAAGERFCEERFLFWLMGLRRYASTCLFAVAPDVVGDAKATWERSKDWLGAIRVLGFPAALVAQDGFDFTYPHDTFDVIFIGGSTEWKLGKEAEAVIQYYQILGKHVHVGRVNSAKRYARFSKLGVDSADGTFVKYGPDKNIPIMKGWYDDHKDK